ncbi:MAG: hypothetical protein MMC33_004840 [Icmadophila ericetorum]|nr:hypothetical protein [Icmadophila ericetorum]
METTTTATTSSLSAPANVSNSGAIVPAGTSPIGTSAAASTPSPLPHPRLVTTSHDPTTGKSHISSDSTLAPFYPFGPTRSGFVTFHTSETVPASNSGTYTPSATTTLPRPPPQGTTFGVTDIPPGGMAPMHQTQTVDYAVVLEGEIVLLLDEVDERGKREERVIGKGEFAIQRGTRHGWVNRGTGVCRMGFVMVGAEEIK